MRSNSAILFPAAETSFGTPTGTSQSLNLGKLKGKSFSLPFTRSVSPYVFLSLAKA